MTTLPPHHQAAASAALERQQASLQSAGWVPGAAVVSAWRWLRGRPPQGQNVAGSVTAASGSRETQKLLQAVQDLANEGVINEREAEAQRSIILAKRPSGLNSHSPQNQTTVQPETQLWDSRDEETGSAGGPQYERSGVRKHKKRRRLWGREERESEPGGVHSNGDFPEIELP